MKKKVSVAEQLVRMSSPYRERDEYRDWVQKILTAFQYLEEGLKIYLDQAFWFIKIAAKNKVPFKHSRKNIEGMGLRRLIDLFSKYNSNQRLKTKLKKHIDTRNQFAHKGFLLYHGTKNDIAQEIAWLKKNVIECEQLLPEVSALVDEVIEETDKLVSRNTTAD